MTGILVVAAAVTVVSRVSDPAATRQTTNARPPPARVHPPPTAVSAADVGSLRRVRSIAAGQLRGAGRVLAECPSSARIRASARGVTAWIACARWPVAHLTVNARINAGIFSMTAQRLPVGRCRSMALGRANAMRLVGEAAHELEAGAWDRSPAGRAATAQRLASLRRLIRYASDGLRGRTPGCGRAADGL